MENISPLDETEHSYLPSSPGYSPTSPSYPNDPKFESDSEYVYIDEDGRSHYGDGPEEAHRTDDS